MNPAAVEVNDEGILVGRPGACPTLAPSPGYARISRDEIEIGTAAQRRARLEPRHVSHRHWDRLDTATIGRPFPAGVTHADLVHHHLVSLWAEIEPVDEITLAVPGAYGEAQLSLLLAVARAAGLPVRGLVDAALAAATVTRIASRTVVVDLQLHRAVATELEDRIDGVARGRVLTAPAGLYSFRETWARWVADSFVRATRFDPFHAAATEQRLFDALPAWLASLRRRPAVDAVLGHGNTSHTVTLERDEVEAAADGQYAAVCELVVALGGPGESPAVLMTARAASVPGLSTAIARASGVEIATLPETAVLEGVLRHRDQIVSAHDALPLVTELRTTKETRRISVREIEADDDGPAPTHVVYQGRAVPLGGGALVLGSSPPPGERRLVIGDPGLAAVCCRLVASSGVSVEAVGEETVLLQGELVTTTARARVGDRLRLGPQGPELSFIAIGEDDGS